MDSASLLQYFHATHKKEQGKDVNLTLRPAYKNLLAALGHPERHLPPTIHIAGTNGKGSTGAFLRAILEETGKTVHITTSPHLVSFHERIRVAGKLISEEFLVEILKEMKEKAEPGGVSYFEAIIAVALTAFARTQADATIIEVGLGGRLDATNIIPKSVASIITRLSYDHRDFLGQTMSDIAYEKAGIMRQATPCFLTTQPSNEASATIHEEANDKHVPLHMAGIEWNTKKHLDGSFDFISARRTLQNIPCPALYGDHQIENAALAIAALDSLPFTIPDEAIYRAMSSVYWPGRMQRLSKGKLYAQLPAGTKLWLDGGHNDSAAEVLVTTLKKWDQPIDMVIALLSSKTIEDYIKPLLPYARSIQTLRVDGEIQGYDADYLSKEITKLGHTNVRAESSLTNALSHIEKDSAHTLICGSLYFVGHALKENDTPPFA